MKFTYIQFLVLIILFGACSKGDGETNDVEPPVQVTIDPPLAAVLSLPVNNEVCETGVAVSELHSRVNFQWSAAQNADHYTLRIQNLETQELMVFTAIVATSKEVELVKGTPYAWRVTSEQNEGTQTADSSRWQFYLSGEGITNYPPYPANLLHPASGTRFTASTTSIELTWNAVDPDGENLVYTLYLDSVDGLQTPAATNTNISQTSKQIDVASGNTYYWRIKATDPNGNSSFSMVYSFLIE